MKKQPTRGISCEVIILLQADDVYGILNKKIQSGGGGTGGGSGDMLKSVYDITGKNTDIFKYADNKSQEVIQKVLTKDNITEYTPASDYNPATKKYVDDIVGDINNILDNINGEVV